MIYARQIRPELQESPLQYDECYPYDMIVCGNRYYQNHTIDVYDLFMDNWEFVYDAMKDCAEKYEYRRYNTVTEAIMDNFPPQHKQKYSSRDIHAWKSILEEMCYEEEEVTICKALDLITGKSWDTTEIHGCCQGDWQTIIYCTDTWNRAALREFEMEYFNLGSEWMIHEGTEAPETPEDINGFTVYCATYDDDEIRRIIADAACGNPDEVVMYAHDGMSLTDNYRIA